LGFEKIYDIFYRRFHNQIRMHFIVSEKLTYLKIFRKEDHLPHSVNPIRQHRRLKPSIFVINLKKEVHDTVSVDIKIKLIDD